MGNFILLIIRILMVNNPQSVILVEITMDKQELKASIDHSVVPGDYAQSL